MEERDREEEKSKYTKHHPIALSIDFVKNWVFSESSQDLLPQGETNQNKKTKNKKQTKLNKTKIQAPSVYFLGWKPEQIQQIFTQGPSHV